MIFYTCQYSSDHLISRTSFWWMLSFLSLYNPIEMFTKYEEEKIMWNWYLSKSKKKSSKNHVFFYEQTDDFFLASQ